MHKTLTIVIPAYNESEHIVDCLDSIAAQTVPPDEVIVVNNNSSDDTAQIVRSFPFVRVINEPRQGILHAHRAGFTAATSELIGRIDADSELPTDWVQRMKSHYEDTQTDHVIFGSGYGRNLRFRKAHTTLMDAGISITKLLLGNYILWGSNLVMPRTIWNTLDSTLCPARSDTFDDIDMALHLHEQNIPIIWRQDIRVPVTIRNIYSFRSYIRYCMRSPRTLKIHGDKRWPAIWMIMIIYSCLHYPFFVAIRKNIQH